MENKTVAQMLRENRDNKAWKQRSKYNRVNRAHPFKESAKFCKWEEITTAKGRKILMPLP